IEVKVPNLKIARDSYRRVIARGRRVVYMPQELAAPDKIPILCQTFGFRLPDDFDPNLFENEADQWGWYHVEGSAATPNFPSNQKDIDVMYEKLGVEGQTLNTYLLASAHNWIANRRHFDQAIKTRAILTGSIYKGYPIGVYSEKGGAMQIIPEKNLYERILYRGVRSAGLIERV
ncbi:hypothetical protein M1307_00690, partial [Patescibacteria group bacterium]|nr:hypothetical protein [Patescibacteria group bacterium]